MLPKFPPLCSANTSATPTFCTMTLTMVMTRGMDQFLTRRHMFLGRIFDG